MRLQQGYLATLVLMPLHQILPIQRRDFLQPASAQLVQEQPALLSSDQADQLLGDLVAAHSEEDCCVLPPLRFDPSISAPIHHLFLCSNTLREGLYYLEKYSTLLSEQLAVNVTRSRMGPLRVKLELKESVTTELDRWRCELLISTLLSWLRQLCGSRLTLQGIGLPWSETDYTVRYRQQWQTDVSFNQPVCALELNPESLDLGLHHTNPNITQLMRREVELQHRKLARAGSLSDHIIKALANGQLALAASQQDIAAHFNISTRTLNRHLQKDQTSLKQLVTQVRLEQARQLLITTSASIDDIAVQLGLSGRRALDRIFQKSLGLSPAQFRQENDEPSLGKQMENS
ncbi:AraC family transcriptional regulator [Oceanobacter mangrovi]|uniref:AraC family transcriptional regulator n=1 Tax=Oceanobacter mangrovi TaxID=2862510 RepID=UPI001C8F06FC|nr:AraC family transcriptional regulator [Oceanobacter mangrovi]